MVLDAEQIGNWDVDFTSVLDRLWHNVMETDDHKTGGDHELEVSPYVFDCLKADMRFNHDFVFEGAIIKYRSWFKIKFVMESIPDAPAVNDGPDFASSAKCSILEFMYVALRVECRNGRFSYFDWDKNRESMK